MYLVALPRASCRNLLSLLTLTDVPRDAWRFRREPCTDAARGVKRDWRRDEHTAQAHPETRQRQNTADRELC